MRIEYESGFIVNHSFTNLILSTLKSYVSLLERFVKREIPLSNNSWNPKQMIMITVYNGVDCQEDLKQDGCWVLISSKRHQFPSYALFLGGWTHNRRFGSAANRQLFSVIPPPEAEQSSGPHCRNNLTSGPVISSYQLPISWFVCVPMTRWRCWRLIFISSAANCEPCRPRAPSSLRPRLVFSPPLPFNGFVLLWRSYFPTKT